MSDKRNIKLYLKDILDSVDAITEFAKDLSFKDFIKDRKTCSAVIREFEVIGEAVGKLPDELKNQYSQVKWQDIKDLRNLLSHEYFGIDMEIIWKIIQDDLPVLLKTVNTILSNLDNL